MRTRIPATVWLWLSLVFPSLFVVDKYLDWPGVILYAFCCAIALARPPSLPAGTKSRTIFRLAVATFLVVALAFLVLHPVANTQTAGTGSDDDDAYNVGVLALLRGESPYIYTTYLGNVLHQLPGAFVLAAPFVLLGTSAWQNLFWLAIFFVAVRKEVGCARTALLLAWTVLVLSPTVLHQVVTGTAHLSNTIYVLVGLWWLIRTRHRQLAGVAWGVALASRANFLFLVPLAYGWLHQHCGWRVAARTIALTCITVAGLTIPFYFNDPLKFGPLEASDRLLRFDALIPHLGGALIAATATLSLWLSLRPLDRSSLFWSCAVVQAFPVVMGLLLSNVTGGRLDFTYAAYGTFSVWFVLMALIVADRTATCAHERLSSRSTA